VVDVVMYALLDSLAFSQRVDSIRDDTFITLLPCAKLN